MPELLETALSEIGDKRFSILDLGCGDGALLYSLQSKVLLKNADLIVGVDTSEARVKRLVGNVRGVTGLVSDACDVKELDDQSFDLIICSQLIEHVPSDDALLREIRRLLKATGHVYISSVIKEPYGFWIYRSDGVVKLDPTHVREYSSEEEFRSLLQRNGFETGRMLCKGFRFAIPDLVIRALIRIRLLSPEGIQTIFLRHGLLAKCRRILNVPILGYKKVEVLARVAGRN